MNANLTGCRIYGMSAWDLNLEGVRQADLIITRRGQPEITVDNLEMAEFIYLLLNNERIRHVIDTITSKVVLILGRFTPERKAVLDALREELRERTCPRDGQNAHLRGHWANRSRPCSASPTCPARTGSTS